MIYRNRNIKPQTTLLEALKKMDSLDKKLLVVEEKDKFIGLLSAGDIQRAIIHNISLEKPVDSVLRKNIRVARQSDSLDHIKKMMFDFRMELCPLISNDEKIIDVLYWEDLFVECRPSTLKPFNLPVVIMAGGLGSRLKPLTNVLPKPLIPIGDKTMLEEIFDRFSGHGCKDFYISVNYKAELIKFYINNLKLPFNISFIEETKSLGTAGSLSLLKGKINQTFFVTNCDILIDQDYSEILDYHNEQKNEITIVAALKHFPIPYGTIETGDNGYLRELNEKPELTFKINSGMYILEPHLIDEMPDDKVINTTDLIWNLKQNDLKVGVFPVSQNSWTDIGYWNEYLSILEKKSTNLNTTE